MALRNRAVRSNFSISKYGYKPADKISGTPNEAKKALVRPITYRPFDTRWTIWTGTTQGYVAWPSADAMKQYLNARDENGRYHNIGLVTARQNTSGRADHFFGSSLPSEMKTAESTRGSLTFPLYRYLNEGGVQPLFGAAREANISPDWIEFLASRTGLAYTVDGLAILKSHLGPRMCSRTSMVFMLRLSRAL